MCFNLKKYIYSWFEKLTHNIDNQLDNTIFLNDSVV